MAVEAHGFWLRPQRTSRRPFVAGRCGAAQGKHRNMNRRLERLVAVQPAAAANC